MKMNRIALSLSLMALLAAPGVQSLSAFADPATSGSNGPQAGRPHHSPQERKAHREEMGQKFKQELNLSNDQEARIQQIRKKFYNAHEGELKSIRSQHKEMMESRKNGADKAALSEKRGAMKKDFESLRADRMKMKAEIDAVLTPEQRQKMDSMRQNMHQQRGGGKHHGGRGFGGPGGAEPSFNAPPQ